MSTTKFYYKEQIPDSIVVERTIDRGIADRWYPSPISGVSKIKYTNIKIQNTDYFKALFPSLGFAPRDMHFYWQCDVLPYTIEEFTTESAAVLSDYTLALQYTTDSQGKLISIKYSSKRGIDGTMFWAGSGEYRLTY